MKKLITMMLVAVLAVMCAACSGSSGSGKYEGQTLHLYNAGEYIEDDVIKGFEKRTGANIVLDIFESNEQMYIKVANGDAYDILIPSDYMIERLMQEELLQPLQKEKLTCIKDIDPDLLARMDFDPGQQYAIPYFWGTVGIIYDTRVVDENDVVNEGYGIFANPKYKGDIYLYDSERDMFMTALKELGYSMNTESEAELNEAYELLLNIVNTMEPEIVTDEIIDNMAQARKALGIMYSGEAVYVMSENENMAFYMPDYGTNIWMDCMVIPKNAEHVDLAHEFINYVSEYEAASINSKGIGYTSPNLKVKKELSGNGGEYEGVDAYIPRMDNANDEVFHYSEKARKIMAELWAKVKIAASNA
ncbi:MAG: ABC transporter substrate-binding protein [Lachnospiraceae bacterium]|nr:ABC transporter substrate-binding protein [Lachnospiraceae bacterium]